MAEPSNCSSDLTEFLRNLGVDGAESSDHEFTLAFKSLCQRYQTFQNDNESYYLLRLLQGLVRVGASGINIRTTRCTVEVLVSDFKADPPEWLTPTVLAERLSQPQHWDRSLHAVCSGIVCTCNDKFEELTWSFNGETLKGTSSPTYDYAVSRSEPSSTELRILIRKKKSFIFSSTSVEHSELATRLGACPVPVVLDKLPLTLSKPQQAAGKKEDWFYEFTSPFVLAEAEAGSGKPEDFEEWSTDFGCSPSSDSWAAFKWYCDPTGAYARVALSVRWNSTGIISPVIDGVLGGSFQTPDLPGIICYIDAEDLDTDLSGFALIDTSPLLARISSWYRPLLEKVRQEVDRVRPVWDDSHPNYTVSESIMSAGADPLSALVVIPVFAMIRMTEASTSFLLFQLKKNTLQKQLQELLRERLDEALSR
mgnify:CR=1 FL=1